MIYAVPKSDRLREVLEVVLGEQSLNSIEQRITDRGFRLSVNTIWRLRRGLFGREDSVEKMALPYADEIRQHFGAEVREWFGADGPEECARWLVNVARGVSPPLTYHADEEGAPPVGLEGKIRDLTPNDRKQLEDFADFLRSRHRPQ